MVAVSEKVRRAGRKPHSAHIRGQRGMKLPETQGLGLGRTRGRFYLEIWEPMDIDGVPTCRETREAIRPKFTSEAGLLDSHYIKKMQYREPNTTFPICYPMAVKLVTLVCMPRDIMRSNL